MDGWVRESFELKKCFSRIESEAIFRGRGVASEDTAVAAVNMTTGGSRNWLNTNRMYEYLHRNPSHVRRNDIVTVCVPGLREMYSDYVYGEYKAEYIRQTRNADLIGFANIYRYRSLRHWESRINMYEYQLDGQITGFDVLHFKVHDFVRMMNNRAYLSRLVLTLPNEVPLFVDLEWKIGDTFSVELQRDMMTTPGTTIDL